MRSVVQQDALSRELALQDGLNMPFPESNNNWDCNYQIQMQFSNFVNRTIPVDFQSDSRNWFPS